MADKPKTFKAKIVRDNYTFRGRGIPKGTIVEVTETQFESMTRMDPPFAEKVSATEAKKADTAPAPLADAGEEMPAPKDK